MGAGGQDLASPSDWKAMPTSRRDSNGGTRNLPDDGKKAWRQAESTVIGRLPSGFIFLWEKGLWAAIFPILLLKPFGFHENGRTSLSCFRRRCRVGHRR